MREDTHAKARRLLTEGRLIVLRRDDHRVAATCRGDSGEVYDLGYDDRGWWCSCAARGRCSHVTALMLITIRPATASEEVFRG